MGRGAGFGQDRPADCAIVPELVDWDLVDWDLPDWDLPDWDLPDWDLPDWDLPDWAGAAGSDAHGFGRAPFKGVLGERIVR
jgi:hypothetical protein